MRLTEQLVVEATVSGWLSRERSWLFWVDGRAGRKRPWPSLIGLHLPDKLTLAVYCRPHQLRPTEGLDVSWLPAGWVPCVWWPGMHTEVRAWLKVAVTDPPGVVDRSGAGST